MTISVAWVAAGALALNFLLLVLNRLDRRDDKRRAFADAVVRERIKVAGELLSAFNVRTAQIHDLAIYTDDLAQGDPEHQEFAKRSREELFFKRQPAAVERLNGALAAAQVAFSKQALRSAMTLLQFLSEAMEKGPPFDKEQGQDLVQALADALRDEIRVEEAVAYQRRLFGDRKS